MLSDDVYRSQLAVTFARLQDAVAPFAPDAQIASAATPVVVWLIAVAASL